MFLVFVLALFLQITNVSALQCFNCYGVSNYDPNNCFTPSIGNTFMQECAKGEVCEKRVTQIDRLQDVIDRGCSPNCQGKNFIWTDEFQVYCCDEKSLCNSASKFYPVLFIFVTIASAIAVVIL